MRIDTRKLLGTIIGVAAFAMMVIALTYAYYTWKSEETLVIAESVTVIIP